MDREQLKKLALKQVMEKTSSRAPRRVNGKRQEVVKVGGVRAGRTFGRQKQLLKDIRSGEKVYISTLDVEMTKWRFKDATKVELILVETNHDNIFKAEINETK